MQTLATDSSLEVASWFLQKAQNEQCFLEPKKLHNLLLLSQLHYSAFHTDEILMPCIFIANHDGFEEPSISSLQKSNIPLTLSPRFSPEINKFLNKIWTFYGKMSNQQLIKLVQDHSAYQNYGTQKSIVDIPKLLLQFNLDNNKKAEEISYQTEVPIKTKPRKIMLSQHGPVLVSQWKPRKITATPSDSNAIQE